METRTPPSFLFRLARGGFISAGIASIYDVRVKVYLTIVRMATRDQILATNDAKTPRMGHVSMCETTLLTVLGELVRQITKLLNYFGKNGWSLVNGVC